MPSVKANCSLVLLEKEGKSRKEPSGHPRVPVGAKKERTPIGFAPSYYPVVAHLWFLSAAIKSCSGAPVTCPFTRNATLEPKRSL